MFEKFPYIQNLQGFVEVQDWGDLPEYNKESKGHLYFEHKVDLSKSVGDGAYVKILRQSYRLQIYVAWKRPGFKRYELLEGMREIDDLLLKFGVRGLIQWKQFELREQMRLTPRVIDLKDNPIERSILEGAFVIKFYEEKTDPELVNKEVKIRLPNAISSRYLLNYINNIAIGLDFTAIVAMMKDHVIDSSRAAIESQKLVHQSFDKSTRTIDRLTNDIVENAELTSNEFWDLSNEFTQVKENSNEMQKEIQTVLVQVTDLKNQIQETFHGGTPGILPSSSGPEQESTAERNETNLSNIEKYMAALTENITKLSEKAIKHDSKLDQIHGELINSQDNLGGTPGFKSSPNWDYLKHEYRILESDIQLVAVKKILKKLKQVTSKQVKNILPHILETSIGRALTDLAECDDNVSVEYFVDSQTKKRKALYKWRNKN